MIEPTEVDWRPQSASTNDDIAEIFRLGRRRPVWIVARRQLSGRGRQGRIWQHFSGNFAGSLLWPLTDAQMRTPALLPFTAGLAVLDAATDFGVRPDALKLKWPNDILLNGGKLGGILVEALETVDAIGWACVGIGVNLVHTPDDVGYPAQSLSGTTGATVTVEDWIQTLDQAWRRHIGLATGRGFSAVREAWLTQAAGVGRQVRIAAPSGDHVGVFSGLADDGALLLREPDGTQRRFLAGDVSLRVE